MILKLYCWKLRSFLRVSKCNPSNPANIEYRLSVNLLLAVRYSPKLYCCSTRPRRYSRLERNTIALFGLNCDFRDISLYNKTIETIFEMCVQCTRIVIIIILLYVFVERSTVTVICNTRVGHWSPLMRSNREYKKP